MAKQIIIQRVAKGPGGDLDIQYLFWLAVPTGQEIPLAATVTSAWTGASALENTALQNGTVIEEAHETQVPTGTTKAAIENGLLNHFNNRQAQLNARQNPNQYYGVFFDSVTGWSA
jgi:hypothetical protein